jgi:hypothetical protein
MSLKRTIEADKAGIIEHLKEARQDADQNVTTPARSSATAGMVARQRAYWRGRSDGLDFAIRALEAWQAGDER